MVIEVKGIESLLRKLEKAGNYDPEEVTKQMVLKVARRAKSYAPVDTGALRGSVKSRPARGEVYTQTSYAVHQEFGTYRMKAQPFLRPALRDEIKASTREYTNDIKKKLKRL